jgi:hypothetical protein
MNCLKEEYSEESENDHWMDQGTTRESCPQDVYKKGRIEKRIAARPSPTSDKSWANKSAVEV